MDIISTLKSILTSLLYAFLNEAERTFKKLPQDLQTSLIEQGRLSQIIKLNFARGLEAIQAAAYQELNMTPETTDYLLQQLARKFNLANAQELVAYWQVNTVGLQLDNSAWDSLWTLIAGQLQVIASGGKINWATVAFGLTEFIYRKFVQGKFG